MKKILKIGCGCLAALILITVLLIICAESCSGPVSQPAQNMKKEDEFQLLLDESSYWERKTAEVENTSARKYLLDYCRENGHKMGFDQKKQTFCRISSCEFKLQCPPSDKIFAMRHANQIRRAALKALLENLDVYAQYLMKNKPTTEKIKNGDKISVGTELRLKNIVFKGKSVATQQTFVNGKDVNVVAESFCKERTLFYKGHKLLEYVLDEQGVKYIMPQISVRARDPLSEADRYSMLQPFLNLVISDGLPVIMEHTAYSWDEKKMRGEVALLLVYKIKPDKRDQ